MPSLVVEAGLASRILSHREIMISLAGLCLVLLTLLLGRVNSAVLLLTETNGSWSFPDTEAAFAPRVPKAGIVGTLHAANPLDACLPLANVSSSSSPYRGRTRMTPTGTTATAAEPTFLLVERGICTFEEKVRHAQDAGYQAVIVYNNNPEDYDLLTMSGDATDIHIQAVFVSTLSGQFLLQYAGDKGATCYIMPEFENTAWAVMVVWFIALLAVTSVLATFFFVRQFRLRQLSARFLPREPAGMSVKEVNALPSVVFKCIEDDKGTSETCAICLEDYVAGETLRLLPCQHEFHLDCIDQWLTTRKPFCPVCKRDAQSKCDEPVATERTPLLAAAAAAAAATATATGMRRGASDHHLAGSIGIATPVPSPRITSSLRFTPSQRASLNYDTPDTRIFSLSYPDGGEDLC